MAVSQAPFDRLRVTYAGGPGTSLQTAFSLTSGRGRGDLEPSRLTDPKTATPRPLTARIRLRTDRGCQ